MGFTGMDQLVPALKTFVSELQDTIILPGCGHWTQQERPEDRLAETPWLSASRPPPALDYAAPGPDASAISRAFGCTTSDRHRRYPLLPANTAWWRLNTSNSKSAEEPSGLNGSPVVYGHPPEARGHRPHAAVSRWRPRTRGAEGMAFGRMYDTSCRTLAIARCSAGGCGVRPRLAGGGRIVGSKANDP
jgi:hypothetical protein